jgi:CTP-dependent riboflavin kinase
MNDNYIKNKVTQVGNRLIIPNSLNHFTKVELIDLSGRLKVSNNFKNNIDVSDFNEGVYLIRFSNYKKNLSQKIFISNFN